MAAKGLQMQSHLDSGASFLLKLANSSTFSARSNPCKSNPWVYAGQHGVSLPRENHHTEDLVNSTGFQAPVVKPWTATNGTSSGHLILFEVMILNSWTGSWQDMVHNRDVIQFWNYDYFETTSSNLLMHLQRWSVELLQTSNVQNQDSKG